MYYVILELKLIKLFPGSTRPVFEKCIVFSEHHSFLKKKVLMLAKHIF